MVVFSSFYNHWMLRYLTKRQSGAVLKMKKCRFVNISSIILASSGHKRMKIPPFDSSRCTGSNGSIFILLPPLNVEIFHQNRILTFYYSWYYDTIFMIMWFGYIFWWGKLPIGNLPQIFLRYGNFTTLVINYITDLYNMGVSAGKRDQIEKNFFLK